MHMTTPNSTATASQSTQRETVRLLCKSILNRLENQKAISFAPRLRQVVQDELYGLIGPSVMTDQDIRDRVFARLGAKAEALAESELTETDQFRAAKQLVRSQLGDDVLNGLYFQKPIRELAVQIAQYLMRSSHIDDVFESDEEIEKKVVETVQRFDPKQVH
jgi:hypothetical protein